MSLPARQQKLLDQIELALQAADPRLKSMFAAFTRFTSRDAMPPTEAMEARMPRLAVLISVTIISVASVIVLGLYSTSTACPRLPSDQTVATAAVRLAACKTNDAAWSKGGR